MQLCTTCPVLAVVLACGLQAATGARRSREQIERLTSDRSRSWGALMGIMAFIEAGEMPAPEDPMPDLETAVPASGQ